MTVVALDTSCLVAAACSWHEHHAATSAALARSSARGDEVIVVSHTMLETYSVLTRLPHRHRLSPAIAFALLEANWGARRTAVLTSTESWRLLRDAADNGVAGGLIYDALIAATARKGRAGELWTWNVEHFRRIESELAIVRPDEAR
jgi:predicted nucleic acid-binding protein